MPIPVNVEGNFSAWRGIGASLFGMYAPSDGKRSTTATYHWFEHKGADDLYKQWLKFYLFCENSHGNRSGSANAGSQLL